MYLTKGKKIYIDKEMKKQNIPEEIFTLITEEEINIFQELQIKLKELNNKINLTRLIEGIIQSAENNGIAINGGSVSAMFGFFLCDGPVRNFDEAKTNDAELFGKLHREMLLRGIYLAPSPFEAGFTSLAHSEEEIDKTIEAFDESFSAIKK